MGSQINADLMKNDFRIKKILNTKEEVEFHKNAIKTQLVVTTGANLFKPI